MKLTIDIPSDIACRLEFIAASLHQSKEDIVLDALSKHLSANPTQSSSTPKPTLKRSPHSIRSTAPIAQLVEGILSGQTRVDSVLRNQEDFGLGTLNFLDGEVVVLDGVAYQQTSNGECHPVANDEKTPFMMVTDFVQQDALHIKIGEKTSYAGLCDSLLQHMKVNAFVAIKVVGEFELVHCRAVRKQTQNRPLIEVAKEQALFDFGPEEKGVLVGFWSPKYIGYGLNVPGFHLHYISEDRSHGGHVLDAVLVHGDAYLQMVYHLDQDIPVSDEFQETDMMKRDAREELVAAEGGGKKE